MEIKIPETRGRKPKYDFNVDVGETRSYSGVSVAVLQNCAKSYCRNRGLDWRFHCYTMNGMSHAIRIR